MAMKEIKKLADIEDIAKAWKNDTTGNLLSQIKIGSTVYELKDLIARDSIELLHDLVTALGEEDVRLAGLVTELQTAAQNLADNKADKEQVAKDIKAAVDAEAAIARVAEKANADAIAALDEEVKANDEDIAKINALLETVSDEDNITSLKELALWVEEHGEDAAEMSKTITANTKAIEDEAKARDDADKAIDERLVEIEEALGEGAGSVADQIAGAKEEAIDAAKEYTDDEIKKLGNLATKDIEDLDLKNLAHANTATGTVFGQTISDVKATGTIVTGVSLSDTAVEKDVTATGTFTPAGNVAGTVTIAEHAVPVKVTNNDASAIVTKGTGTSNASVTVTPSTTEVVSGITGSLPTFVEGSFNAGKLETEDVTIAGHDHLTAAVSDEMLTFTASMVDAITFKAVTNYVAPTKAADTWTPGTAYTTQTATVVSGIDSASATVEYEKVTGVTYQKAEENASGTCAGSTVAINATFTGSEGAVNVGGKYTDTTYTASANTGAVELAVGNIVVADRQVTVTADI